MKTINKLQSLFSKLDKAENLIDRYQNSLEVAPFHAIKKALGNTLKIRVILEQNIIKVAELVSKEVDLIELEKEESKSKYAASLGLFVDFDELTYYDDRINKLKQEINEGIK